MSLINQMLKELDARGANVARAGVLQGQIRAVPVRRGLHPAWWIALVLGLSLVIAAIWIWLGRGAPPTPAQKALLASAEIPLQFAADLKLSPRLQKEPSAVPEVASSSQQASKLVEKPAESVAEKSPPKPVEQWIYTPPEKPAKSVAAGAIKFPATPTTVNPAPPTTTSEKTQKAAQAQPDRPAPTREVSALAPQAAVATESTPLVKQVKELTPQQIAENEFRKGTSLAQQGRSAEAISALEQAIQLDASHAAARQTLIALLIESKRTDDAMRRAREGLQLDPNQTGLAMILARLQVEKGETKAAIETMQRIANAAADRAEYQAFFAALLQRESRHREAAERFQLALKKVPQNGVWWMGLGISLQADGRNGEAAEAYNHARSAGLSAELKSFVDEKLKGLQR